MSKIEQEEKYPVAFVIFIYWLMGGVVGGGIYALFFAVIIFFEGSFSLRGIIISPLIIVAGAILGYIPSIFAGIWLALIKFTVTKKSDYFKVAMIGYFSTVFCYLTYTIIIEKGLNNISIDDFFFNIGLVGALSAMILGRFVLPKQRESSEK